MYKKQTDPTYDAEAKNYTLYLSLVEGERFNSLLPHYNISHGKRRLPSASLLRRGSSVRRRCNMEFPAPNHQ